MYEVCTIVKKYNGTEIQGNYIKKKTEVENWLCVSVSFNNLYGADTPGHSQAGFQPGNIVYPYVHYDEFYRYCQVDP